MALFIRQEDERSQLQKNLTAELQRRAKENSKISETPDGIEDTQYVKGMKSTTSLAWVWIMIIIAGVGLAVWLTVLSMAS
jgi:hypothetical protein